MLGMGCHNCANSGRFKCKRCKLGHYCSKECQVDHWKHHKDGCKAFRASTIEYPIRVTPMPPGMRRSDESEEERSTRFDQDTTEANNLFLKRMQEFEKAAVPPKEPMPIQGANEDDDSFAARLDTFQAEAVRISEMGWDEKRDATSGFLYGWFAQRYLHGLFTVYNQKYTDFQKLKLSFERKKARALLAWANLKMDNPPIVLDTEEQIEVVLAELRNISKSSSETNSTEARQREEIEHFINVEFKISQLLNGISKVFNDGIRLNDLCDENGNLLSYNTERIAVETRLEKVYAKAKSISEEIKRKKKSATATNDDKGKGEELEFNANILVTGDDILFLENEADNDPEKAVGLKLRAKDDERRRWFQRIADRLKPIGELIALADTKRDIVQLIDTFMEDPLEFSGRHQNIALFGEPGTGKTEIGTKLGPLFYALGFVQVDPGDTFNALSRADFVSGIVGQTVAQVRDIFLNNLGSFVFIDEAYAIHTDKEDTYGSEAVHEITNELQVYKGLISIAIAGYRDKIQENLFEENPGLSSRFPEQWDFRPYSSPELYHIFSFLAARKGVNLGPSKRPVKLPSIVAGSDADPARLRQMLINLITTMNQDKYRIFKDANGRAMETILSWTIRTTSQRKLKLERENPELTADETIQRERMEGGDDAPPIGGGGRSTPRKGAYAQEGTIMTSTNPNAQDIFGAFQRWASIPRDMFTTITNDGEKDDGKVVVVDEVLYDLNILDPGAEPKLDAENLEADWDVPKDLASGVKPRTFQPIWPIPMPMSIFRQGKATKETSLPDKDLLTDEHWDDLMQRFQNVRVIGVGGQNGTGLVKEFEDGTLDATQIKKLKIDLEGSLASAITLENDMVITLDAYRKAINAEKARRVQNVKDLGRDLIGETPRFKQLQKRRAILGNQTGVVESVPYSSWRPGTKLVGRTKGYVKEVSEFLQKLRVSVIRQESMKGRGGGAPTTNARDNALILARSQGFPDPNDPDVSKEDNLKNRMKELVKRAREYQEILSIAGKRPSLTSNGGVLLNWYKTFHARYVRFLMFPNPEDVKDVDLKDVVKEAVNLTELQGTPEPKGKPDVSKLRAYYRKWYSGVIQPALSQIASTAYVETRINAESFYFY